MAPKEIDKLMTLKNWSRTQLAAALHLTDATVRAWMRGKRNPSGPAVILMQQWLKEGRK